MCSLKDDGGRVETKSLLLKKAIVQTQESTTIIFTYLEVGI